MSSRPTVSVNGRRYRVISFDLDRTLIFHAKGSKHEQVVAMLAGLGYPTTITAFQSATHVAREFYDVLGYQFADAPADLRTKYVQVVLELIGCADPSAIATVASFYFAYDQEPTNFFVPAEATALLEALHRDGLHLVAISSNLFALQRLQHCGLSHVFSTVLTPALGVPKAELYRMLLDSVESDASAVLHIGDDPILDVLAPQCYGIDAILFDPHGKYVTLTWPDVVRSHAELRGVFKPE